MESFKELSIDERVVKALDDHGFKKPTLVQQQAIPIALQRKDLLIQAPTGVGKTLAYAIPLVNTLLSQLNQPNIDGSGTKASIKCVILVPSKELCSQALQTIQGLLKYAPARLSVLALGTPGSTFISEKTRLSAFPTIVIGTPAQVVKHCKGSSMVIDSVDTLIVDEADLILSYGHEVELNNLMEYLPCAIHTMMMSATLSEDVDSLKKTLMKSPVVVKVTLQDDPMQNRLQNYYLALATAPERDVFLYTYALLKLQYLKGKTLIFVNNIERCFHLKLFLETFCISSAVLNSELPIASRVRIVQQFNAGMFDYLIATDEATEDFEPEESGVSRGVDFQHVVNVVNFDFPTSLKSFIHRVGRSGRGNNRGTSLSFFNGNQDSEETFEKIQEYYQLENGSFDPLDINSDEISHFRYRVEDVLRSVTKIAIKDARLREVKAEMINSEKLKAHFEDNPKELKLLKHDKVLRPKAVLKHLKGVPTYLMPKSVQSISQKLSTSSRKERGSYKRRQKRKFRAGARNDPLKSFTVSSIPTAGAMHRDSKKLRKK